MRVVSDDPGADLIAVHAGQVAVENHDIHICGVGGEVGQS